MSVQTKILLLLLAIVSTLIGGLTALKMWEARKFRAIAESRQAERTDVFGTFLKERGDNLKVVVEDSSIWDGMVLAILKGDKVWAEQNISDEMLAIYKVNAVWIYRPDRTLFFSRNNRYAENLRELPLPKQAFEQLFAKSKSCHFFVEVPQGWMEIRGGTVHRSIDPSRESKPEGYLFAGHVWINDDIQQMSRFTGYDIRIIPTAAHEPELAGEEESGRLRFSLPVMGWTGEPVARIVVQNDSALIREMNRSARVLLNYLLIFAVVIFGVLSLSLVVWVRRPLRLLTRGLQTGNTDLLAPLSRKGNEFGLLADLILRFRRTEDALQETEDRLRHAQKLEAVGRLAGGVAHDFNNLLTAIIGYAELLEARMFADDASREFAQLIRQAGQKAAALTKQLLAFSRRQLLLPRVLDLNNLVRELEKLLQRVIGEHIRVILDLQAEDSRVRGDPGQLEQVILNLGVNARDAMPQGGTLTICTENRATADPMLENGAVPSPTGYVFLIVSDTGSGMDAATKERIFEPFFTTKSPGKGTGLGLATVYGVVKQSGGGIQVESEPGKGSRFVLFFPRETASIDTPASIAPSVGPASSGETVLVVEDEEVVRQLVCTVLSEAGYDVLCAQSPSEALRFVREHPAPIQLLVTDVVMPEMHGPALVQQVIALRPEVGVLFISGYSESDISDQGVIEAGLDVLPKPFTKEALLGKVRELLDARRAHGLA